VQPDLYALVAVMVVGLATVAISGFGVRFSRTTSDFLVASRTVGSRWNAAAISGEYLSAASFLGIAGLVLKDGVDALWYPIGFAGGYLALLLFVAAPLRRSGAYTLPDFAEARLRSVQARRMATGLVVIIGWLYLVPQFQGAGLTLSTLTGWSGWVGAVLVAGIAVTNVVLGGMRSITFVQAFQYWLKLAALAVPVFVLLLGAASERTTAARAISADRPPAFTEDSTVRVQTDVRLQVSTPVLVGVRGRTVGQPGRVDGVAVRGNMYWGPGEHQVRAGTTLLFTAGTAVPVVAGAPADNDQWLRPLSGSDEGYPLLATYSLMLALFLGTMGLPHVLVRFYTNPDGRAARSTTLVVLALLGIFYLFPMVCGVLARLYEPQLLVTGDTDAAVLLLPGAVLDSWPARVLGALVAAGAFAAFLSTASGLMVSVAGVLSTDVLPNRIRDFRLAAFLAAIVPLVFALSSQALDIAQVVGMAFAVAASSFCPLLVLGIWWRGLTDAGAMTGLLLGGGLSVLGVLATLLDVAPSGLPGVLAAQPAAFTVPLALVAMILVSKATARRVPGNVARILARLHAPERLGLAHDRDANVRPTEPVTAPAARSTAGPTTGPATGPAAGPATGPAAGPAAPSGRAGRHRR
jgi:Na+(H+)/acetate symporter ActP